MNRNANTIFGFVAAAVLILSGCINNVDTETGGNSNVPDGKCSLTVDSGFSARAAFPQSLAADMVYAAEISYSSSGAKKWLGAASLENSPAVLRNSPSASGEIRFVFCAPEESAEYTITVFACPAGTSVGSAADVENAAAASGQAEFSLKAGQKALETPVKVSLSPTSNVSGTGSVKLPLFFASTLGIVAAEVNVTKDGVSDSGENNYRFKIKVSGNSATLSAVNAPAGTYLVIMKFYNSTTDFSSSTEVAVNSAVQQVSVYPGMTTDCWFIDGKKHGTTAADGTFTRSALELTKYDFTELYVCGKDGGGESDGKRSFYVSSNFGSSVPLANDTYDGSMAKPFATVQKAVDTIAAFGDTSKKYTIYVDGTVEAPYDDFTNGTFISIGTTASNLDLTIKGLSADARAVLNARQKSSYKGCVLTSEDTSLTLENLKITGGKEINSGGIYIKSGNLTLKNCVVTKNESSNGGGGIQFDGEKLIVENSEISGNNGDPGGIWVKEDSAQTKIKNSNIKNNVASSGGGGLKLAGESTIEGCDISGNKAESGVGGGLILSIDNKSCKIINSVINNNTAGENGGGIYMTSGTLILGSGAVIGEKLDPDVAENDISKVATDEKYGNRSTKKLTSDTGTDFDVGAGIFVAGGKVYMYEDSYICRNYTECSGGGVFIKEGAEFFMYGGVVGWNRSNFGGGILCEGRLEILYSSRICYNKVSTQLVQGFCGRGAGIAVNGENGSAQAVIQDSTKIFGNLAVIGANSSTNTDALGAGIYSSDSLTIKGGEIQIYDNDTESDGAAIGIEGGTATLSGCKIYSNSAGRNGGAIYANNENSRITVKIGEENSSDDDVLIEKNSANRGGAFYGANNADFVMNAGKVSENYSTGSNSGDGGGAMFLWGGTSNYSTFTMNGGVISGNRAKNGGAGGAVHIDHGSGGKAAFIMKGGLLSGNKTTDKNGNGSKLGGAIYVKNGGQIKLGGSAVIAVSEESDSCNNIYLGINEKTSVQQKITITGTLTPGNNVKYTARITPQTYTVGKELFQSDTYTITSDDYGKFCVTGNDDSDEWFITTEGKLSKPVAISSLLSSPDFSIYPKLTVSSGDEMKTLAAWVKAKNTMEGYLITQTADITLPDTFTGVGVYNMSPSVTNYVFSGTFDGKGHKITSSGTKTVSIFNNLQNGGIKNVISEGKFLYAGIAYYCNNGIIENCENNAKISGSDSIGGIVGKLGTGATISNCINKGDVEASSKGGGICGWSVNGSNSILNCINLGRVTGTGTLGAVVATNSGNVKNTYYLIGTAAQAIGGSISVASDVAAQFDTNLKTTNTLTVEGTTSNNLIDLLNAWVTANNYNEQQYFSWKIVGTNPALVYE